MYQCTYVYDGCKDKQVDIVIHDTPTNAYIYIYTCTDRIPADLALALRATATFGRREVGARQRQRAWLQSSGSEFLAFAFRALSSEREWHYEEC